MIKIKIFIIHLLYDIVFYYIILPDEVIKPKIRNNITELQALPHYQFVSIKFMPIFIYVFGKGNYIDKN